MCTYDLYGAEHILFGTDMPYGNEFGERVTRETLRAIQEMVIPEPDKENIFESNTKRLLCLSG